MTRRARAAACVLTALLLAGCSVEVFPAGGWSEEGEGSRDFDRMRFPQGTYLLTWETSSIWGGILGFTADQEWQGSVRVQGTDGDAVFTSHGAEWIWSVYTPSDTSWSFEMTEIKAGEDER